MSTPRVRAGCDLHGHARTSPPRTVVPFAATALAVLLAGCAPDADARLIPATLSWEGERSYFLGLNLPWHNYGTDFGTGGWGKYTDWDQVDRQLEQLAAAEVRIVRWFVFADGRYSPEFAADGTVTGLDAQFLDDLDRALELAELHDLYLLPVMLDFYAFEVASWSGTVQLGGHAALATDAAVRSSFLENALRPMLEFVADHPYWHRVVAWDIVNEPEWMIDGLGGDGGITTEAMRALVGQSAAAVHQYGGGAYATLGSAGGQFVRSWTGLELDFYQVHYYPWMDGLGEAGSGLKRVASLGLDRPVLLGEFSTVAASYVPEDTTPHSAQWYLDTALSRGYAGALGWSAQAQDDASSWASFQPVFTGWALDHPRIVGPR